MRNVTLMRPLRYQASGVKLKVLVDGVQVGTVASGKNFVVTIDENQHHIRLQGGALAGKGFYTEMWIPDGTYNYGFQVDVLATGGKNKPVLRPSNGAVLRDSTGMITVMGVEITSVLLNSELRATLRQAPEARLGVVLEHDCWNLIFANNGQLTKVASMPYKEYKGSFWQAGLASDERDNLDSYDGKAMILEMLFSEFLCMLPDYERTALDEMRFKG